MGAGGHAVFVPYAPSHSLLIQGWTSNPGTVEQGLRANAICEVALGRVWFMRAYFTKQPRKQTELFVSERRHRSGGREAWRP